MHALDEGANPMLLRRGIEEATAAIVAELQRVARTVDGDELVHVATIAAKEDERHRRHRRRGARRTSATRAS